MQYVIRIKHFILDYTRIVYHFLGDPKTRSNLLLYVFSKNKKNIAIMRKERSILRKYWGCFPIQYYAHHFYDKECQLTLDDMKDYIPGYFFYKILYPQFDDVKGALPLIENKIAMNHLFNQIGISQSNIMLIKREERFYTFSGKQLNIQQIEALLSTHCSPKIFIKPVNGRGGKGIMIATGKEGGFFLGKGVLVDVAFLRNLVGDYVIESSIEQSEYLSTIYPHSVNTLRAITKRDSKGEVSLIAVTLRMGVNGSQIDNSAAGGILIGIDLVEGRCIREYATHECGVQRFYYHPDTHFNFSELLIPSWSIVKQQIIENAKKLTQLNLVGWDAAITDDGVVMIEANILFGLDHTQSGVGGLREMFSLETPREYLYMRSSNA